MTKVLSELGLERESGKIYVYSQMLLKTSNLCSSKADSSSNIEVILDRVDEAINGLKAEKLKIKQFYNCRLQQEHSSLAENHNVVETPENFTISE